MTEEGLNYLRQFVNRIKNDKSKNNCCFRLIRQSNGIRINKKDLDYIFTDDNVLKYYHIFSNDNMMMAYEPFFDIIRDIVLRKKLDINRIMQESDIYSLHKNIFKNYILYGKCTRDDEPILTEIEFERKLFVTGIVSIMETLSKMYKIYILLNRFNLVCDSSLEVLAQLLELNTESIFIIGISNEMGYINSYMSDQLLAFRKKAEIKGIVCDWPSDIIEHDTDSISNFIFTNRQEDNYLLNLQNMYYSFAYDQAVNYLSIIYQKIEMEKYKTSDFFQLAIIKLYIKICINQQNYSYALLLCENLKKISQPQLKLENIFDYWFLNSTVNMYNGNVNEAQNGAKKCIGIAEKMESSYKKFKALLLQNMAILSGWKDIWIVEKDIEVSDELIEGCKNYHYMNHLAHIYVYCYDNNPKYYENINEIEKKTVHVTMGINIAKKLKNYSFLVEAYKKNIMLASISGYFEASNYLYKKAIKVVAKQKNEFEEGNIYNGMGYNCCSSSKYCEAHKYYNKALQIFCNLNNCDFIAETLYNMGMNAILAGDYANATEYLVFIYNILKRLKLNSLRVCNISKVFGLIALSTYRQGNMYLSKFYLDKAQQFLEYILNYDEKDFYRYLWDDDMFLYYYVLALHLMSEKEYEKALEYFDKSYVYISRSNGSKFFTLPQYTVDKYRLLILMEKRDEAEALIHETFTYLKSVHNEIMINHLKNVLFGEGETDVVKMTLKKMSLDKIMEIIRIESIEKDANSKKNDIQFFSNFQEFINQNYSSVEDEMETLIRNFKNNFNLDNVLYIACDNEKTEVKYTDLSYVLSGSEVNFITQYFKKNPVGFVLSKLSNNYCEYDKLLSIFKRSKLFSIIGAPVYKNDIITGIFIVIVKIKENWNSAIERKALDEEELEIYQTIFRQIIDALDKYRLNEMLKHQAHTDELTGLLNRKGYYEEIEKMLKYSQDNNNTLDVTLIYADLDHFKYYNDTYGHHVGDALLKEFARILRASCDDLGIVVRFGGDEFIMILNFTDRGTIDTIINKIYKNIEMANGFEDIVNRYTNLKVEIPKKFRATCSIGISIAFDVHSDDDISEMRKQADSALYKVKKSGKGYAQYFQ